MSVSRFKWLKEKMGYADVISMDSGIRSWREKKYPLAPG